MTQIFKESVQGIRSFPLEDELFNVHRELFLVSDVNPETSNELIKQLMYLDRVSHEEITLYINSPGGAVYSGLAVYDYIEIMKSPLKTVCIGDAASMGAILFLAGDKREMLPHTRIMIHDPSYNNFDMSGKKPHEIQQEVDSLNKTRERLAEIIAEKTGKSLDKIYKVTANDTFFTADEAIEFGLATAVYKGV